jgi:hypothetical protein
MSLEKCISVIFLQVILMINVPRAPYKMHLAASFQHSTCWFPIFMLPRKCISSISQMRDIHTYTYDQYANYRWFFSPILRLSKWDTRSWPNVINFHQLKTSFKLFAAENRFHDVIMFCVAVTFNLVTTTLSAQAQTPYIILLY